MIHIVLHSFPPHTLSQSCFLSYLACGHASIPYQTYYWSFMVYINEILPYILVYKLRNLGRSLNSIFFIRVTHGSLEIPIYSFCLNCKFVFPTKNLEWKVFINILSLFSNNILIKFHYLIKFRHHIKLCILPVNLIQLWSRIT